MALSNLALRTLSALVLAPLVLGAVWLGGAAYAGLVLAITFIGFKEWADMTCPKERRHPAVLPIGFFALGSFLLPVCFYAFLVDGDRVPVLGMLFTFAQIFVWLLPLAGIIYVLAKKRTGTRAAAWCAVGIPYLALGSFSLLFLRSSLIACPPELCARDLGWSDMPFLGIVISPDAQGLAATLYLLAIVWGTDIGAYVAGLTIGGPKICPKISPKKTWAGLGGGMTTAALAGAGISTLSGGENIVLAAGFGAVLAIVAQMGDFFESFVKRAFNVKDSGTLIPGHGGVLDRVDGLLFAAFFMALVALSGGLQ